MHVLNISKSHLAPQGLTAAQGVLAMSQLTSTRGSV